jgi:hypothetical protein
MLRRSGSEREDFWAVFGGGDGELDGCGPSVVDVVAGVVVVARGRVVDDVDGDGCVDDVVGVDRRWFPPEHAPNARKIVAPATTRRIVAPTPFLVAPRTRAA